jgi:hypothetical protein
MIGWFPTPYPDELFYSICARYKEQADYPSHYSANEDLFGHKSIYAGIVLPTHLERLVSSLPSGHHLTADRLIDNHTLLPFYSYFSLTDRIKRMRYEMRHSNGSRIYRLSGIYAFSVNTPEFLRFCSACVKEDRSRFGCTYWHRVHQLPGVDVCPDHAVFLQKSLARAGGHISWQGYAPAEHEVSDSLTRFIDPLNSGHAVLLSIAQDAKWLLLNGNTPCDSMALIDRYLIFLSDRGLAVMSGKVKAKKLLRALKEHYTSDILRILQSDFDEKNPTSWPAKMLNKMREGKGNHPLRHFLTMRFLGHSVQSFFKVSAKQQPFGTGPWPCLNRICSQYKKLCITETEFVYRRVYSQGIRPVAIFKCGGCGFTYNRPGPDRVPKDLFRIGRVLKYGPVWEETLRQYWNDPSQSFTKIRKMLGLPSHQLIREAERLALQFPRRGPRNSVVEKKSKQEPTPYKKKPGKEEINKYRHEWRLLLKSNPGLSFVALTKKCGYRVYNWLNRNDSEWLADHQPRSRKGRESKSKVDWRVRDANLARAVKASAKLLTELPGKPAKITVVLIARNIDSGSKLLNQLHKMPRTCKALEKIVETPLQFAERRFWRAVKSFRDENVSPSRSDLRRRANLHLRDWKALLLKAESDKTLRSLLIE